VELQLTLNQLVLLDRGQAWLVHMALQSVQRELLRRDPDQGQRLSTAEALSLRPLGALLKRLDQLRQRDRVPLKPATPGRKQRPPKPHRLRLPYDQLTTVRLFYARMLANAAASPDLHNVLATVLGRFHQPSLSLETHINLYPANGPGYQYNFL
jgi:hypothetical protein